MAPLFCMVCRKPFDESFLWYVCDHCGYRVCPHCMGSGKQQGPYGSGIKCGQCFPGKLREKHYR